MKGVLEEHGIFRYAKKNGVIQVGLNAEKLGDHGVSVTAVAGKVPVYNDTAKIPGSITGDAVTVGGRTITSGTSDPSGGVSGDIYLEYV